LLADDTQQRVDSRLKKPAFDMPVTGPRITQEGPAERGSFDVWIEAGRVDRRYWRDLWHYRELFLILTWRNLAVRYKQTVAGAAWAVLQPALAVIVMTFIFEHLARLPASADAPYAIMVAAGVLPWQFFSASLASGSQSIVADAALISKVYFPRLLIPGSALAAALADFLIACAVLAAVMVYYEFAPTLRVLALPALICLAILAALGPSLIVSALAVRYRDFRFVVPLVIQFGLYLSPVAYSSALVHDRLGYQWFLVYCLNPMTGVIDAFRWAVLGTPLVDGVGFGISMTVAAVLLGVGLRYFRSVERSFADVI